MDRGWGVGEDPEKEQGLAVGSWPQVTAAFGIDHVGLLPSSSDLPPAQANFCSTPLRNYFITFSSQTWYSDLKCTTCLAGFQPQRSLITELVTLTYERMAVVMGAEAETRSRGTTDYPAKC